MAVHGVDLLLWFFGTEIDAVTASVGPVDEAPEAADHFGEGMIRFRNGPLATAVSSWVDAANPLTLEIVGTRGIVQVRGNDVHGFGFDLEEEDPYPPVDPGAALGRFVDAVRSGNVNGPGIIPPRVAALSTQVVDACYRGARENRWVRID